MRHFHNLLHHLDLRHVNLFLHLNDFLHLHNLLHIFHLGDLHKLVHVFDSPLPFEAAAQHTEQDQKQDGQEQKNIGNPPRPPQQHPPVHGVSDHRLPLRHTSAWAGLFRGGRCAWARSPAARNRPLLHEAPRASRARRPFSNSPHAKALRLLVQDLSHVECTLRLPESEHPPSHNGKKENPRRHARGDAANGPAPVPPGL
mmetsp:Transcript_101435/g.232493  ORF Transcript_101435/g.232493 Transcript_101435/m.232493 type:complete len:200 (-) Transcript_101435:98-697(-)